MIKVDENNNESEIGSKRFPLDEITSQEEYIVQITIPEIEDEEQAAAYINCKIVLFWSDYEFFEEKKKKSEQKLKKLNEALNKTNYYLQKIKEIYGDLKAYESIYNNTNNNINNINNINNNQQIQDNRYTDDKKNLNINNYTNNDNDNENFMQSPSTKIDNLRGKSGRTGMVDYSNDPLSGMRIDTYPTNNQKISFRGKKLVTFLGICLILLGLIGSLKRPDFPNALEGILIVICCLLGIRRGVTKAKIWFKYLVIGDLILIIYDFIWISTHYNYIWIDKYTGGHENFIGFLSVISCVGNILIKAAVGVMLYQQYLNVQKMEVYNK